MKSVQEDVNDILSGMTVTELEGIAKALGWDKETEREKLPNWYGIEGIKFIWHNKWADPEIEYKGRRCSCYVVENTMWERWIYDDNDNLIPEREKDEEGFEKYMLENADEVKELCELALFGGNW